jgi:hypothetical protein
LQIPRPIGHPFWLAVGDPNRPIVIVGAPEMIAVAVATEVISQHFAQMLKLVRLEADRVGYGD